MNRRFLLYLSAALAIVCTPCQAEITGVTRLDRLPEAGSRDRAVFATHAPGRPDELFVVEQRGVIHRLDLTTGQLDNSPFLDISGFVDDQGNEQGLLGLAFHPDYETNGFFYVNYTRDPGPGLDRTRIDRFEVNNPLTDNVVSSGTRASVLEFAQDFPNHNGGWIGFSPNDGYLYISSGDGGDGNDPNNRAQRLNTRLGKMLRVDVDGDGFPADSIENYRVPADNPFANDGNAGTLDDIWAYGLRNPWRASFDRLTGDLWIGDVGQGAREEIDFQAGDSEGGENYGWRLREGTIQTPGSVGGDEPADHVPPVYDYLSNGSNPFGGNSVVGGYVYRGPDPEVQGRYFFGDTSPTQLWTFDPADPYGTVQNVESILNPSGQVSTPYAFAEDAVGNLYVLAGSSIFRIETDALIDGDYNGDGTVDADDYALWRDNLGSTDSLAADGNGNGTIDLGDYNIWRDNLGAKSTDILPDVGQQQVPEPTGLAIVVLGGVLLVAKWRPRRAV